MKSVGWQEIEVDTACKNSREFNSLFETTRAQQPAKTARRATENHQRLRDRLRHGLDNHVVKKLSIGAIQRRLEINGAAGSEVVNASDTRELAYPCVPGTLLAWTTPALEKLIPVGAPLPCNILIVSVAGPVVGAGSIRNDEITKRTTRAAR